MHRLTIHAIVYAAVNGLVIFAWLLFAGSEAGLGDVAADPTQARALGFWPMWLLAPWSTLLIIHAGITATNALRSMLGRAPEPESVTVELVEGGLRKTVEMAEGLLHAAVERGSTAIAKQEDLARMAPGVGESRWVAVMFTDIADSTALTEQHGDAAWHEILTRHRKVVRHCIAANRGEEVATQGDGFFIRHDSIADAVACAVDIQQRLTKRRYRDLPPIRIGIHAGEAVQDHDGDLMGKVINVAARVTDAAEAGEILITESVADNAPPGISLSDGGLRDLKGVAQPRHVLRVDR